MNVIDADADTPFGKLRARYYNCGFNTVPYWTGVKDKTSMGRE
jgi:hypothetical protein